MDGKKLQNKVSRIIFEEMGEETANVFYNVYKGQDPETILKAAQGVLQQLVGPSKARELLNEVYEEFEVPKPHE